MMKLNVTDPDRLDLNQLFCLPYTRGVQVFAEHTARNIQASFAWADGELPQALSARKPFAYE
jgi:hypothetical protein